MISSAISNMDEDTDSRTAAFERKRPHGASENDTHELATSGQSTPRKRIKRQDKAGGQDLGDFITVGGNFSTSTIPMDDAEKSRSDVSFDSDTNKLGGGSPSQAEQKVGGALPSINWNVGSRARIRTTLGGPRTVSRTNPLASTLLSAPTNQAQAKDSSARTSTGGTPRLIGTLSIHEDGRLIVALDPSIPEIPGIKSGVLSPNVKLLNPPPGTLHTSILDDANGIALEQTVEDGQPSEVGGASEDDDAVIVNLQSEQESGEITEGDLAHGKDERNKAQVEIVRMDVEEPVAEREKKKLGPPDKSISSKNKVIVKNLPFELSEKEVCQLC